MQKTLIGAVGSLILRVGVFGAGMFLFMGCEDVIDVFDPEGELSRGDKRLLLLGWACLCLDGTAAYFLLRSASGAPEVDVVTAMQSSFFGLLLGAVIWAGMPLVVSVFCLLIPLMLAMAIGAVAVIPSLPLGILRWAYMHISQPVPKWIDGTLRVLWAPTIFIMDAVFREGSVTE